MYPTTFGMMKAVLSLDTVAVKLREEDSSDFSTVIVCTVTFFGVSTISAFSSSFPHALRRATAKTDIKTKRSIMLPQ
jgi:hypothetical protein